MTPSIFARNIARSDALRGQRLNNVQEKRLADGVSGSCQAVHGTNVHRAVQVNLEQLFDLGIVGIRPALAVAFVHQELVIIQGDPFRLHTAAAGKQVPILMGRTPTGDVNCDDAQQVRRSATFERILDQGVLHDANERSTVGGNRETFHTFVRRSPKRCCR